MPQLVTAHDVDVVLAQWAASELTATDVHNWAEARYAVDGWDPGNGAINEVLSHLDRMDMNLVIADDIPLLRQALLAHSAEGASRLIERTYEIAPLHARRRMCTGDRLYEPFCN